MEYDQGSSLRSLKGLQKLKKCSAEEVNFIMNIFFKILLWGSFISLSSVLSNISINVYCCRIMKRLKKSRMFTDSKYLNVLIKLLNAEFV